MPMPDHMMDMHHNMMTMPDHMTDMHHSMMPMPDDHQEAMMMNSKPMDHSDMPGEGEMVMLVG